MSGKSLKQCAVVFFAVTMVCSFLSQAVAFRHHDYEAGMWVRYKPGKYEKSRKFHRRRVAIKTSEVPGSIIVDTDKKFLFYVVGKNKAVRYSVGVGREGFGWGGSVTVRTKKEWPSWTPPQKMRQRKKAKGIIMPKTVKGGPLNPLGSRAIYLYKGNRDTLYRIHGTNKPWTVGRNVSAGCIRLTNGDVEHLYKRVKIGARVTVIGPGKNSDKIYSPLKSPFLSLFSSI